VGWRSGVINWLCWFSARKSLACHVESLIPIKSIKYILIIKLITKIKVNLRDASIKSN
jgi:hypothetical protein